MDKLIFLNKASQDKRVAELEKLFHDRLAVDFNIKPPRRIGSGGDSLAPEIPAIAFLEPRFEPTAKTFANLPEGTTVFGYAKSIDETLLRRRDLRYISLSDDEEFTRDNNYLTALALKEILEKRFGTAKKKMLIVGQGKLCTEIERVFTETEIHILSFNKQKAQDLVKKYGERAHIDFADLSQFPIIINTVPAKLIGPNILATLVSCTKCKHTMFRAKPAIYELASEPYGFDFGTFEKEKFDYNIEPALPGRFYPDRAARAVYNAICRHINCENAKPSVVMGITGSSCSYLKILPVIEALAEKYDVIPVLSSNADRPNRFCNIDEFKESLKKITGNPIITTIAGSEVLSSNKNIIASLVVPATGNTVAKLCNAITDTPVTMAVKALLRNNKPCVVGISTNDALSGNAANIGTLLNRKNYYFVPFSQDNPEGKPYSMICDFDKVTLTLEQALKGKQIQPIIS